MAVETLPPRRPTLEQPLVLARINSEVIAYGVLLLVSTIAHLWNLGFMAMHHDEAIHAWMSWKFYTGGGGFTCANGEAFSTYCYDPVYHGPSLYILTLLSYLLFGDGDAQARLPMALAGIAMGMSCWWLRPYLGKRGAFVAAVLLSFAPTLLYFSRFARHDGLMMLWELWLVIAAFRWLDSGKAGWLYLLAASAALAIATHELYYIVFFIFGIVTLTRLIYESAYARYLNIGFGVVLLLTIVFVIINPPLPVGEGLYLGEKMLLVAATLGFTWLASRVWTPQPVLLPRLQTLWREQRTTMYIALAILLGLHTVMYTTFFAYPRGLLGPIDGLAYWLGSQQEFARGDQPWYYYFMQLGVYEPLGIIFGLAAAVWLFSRPTTHNAMTHPATAASEANGDTGTADTGTAAKATPAASDTGNDPASDTGNDPASDTGNDPANDTGDDPANDTGTTVALSDNDDPTPPPTSTAAPAPSGGGALAAVHPTLPGGVQLPTGNLFPLVLVVWYFSAIIIFSWAGEKMPWLNVHMALPGNLLAAWVIAQLMQAVPPLQFGGSTDTQSDGNDPAATGALPAWRVLLVPVLLTLLMIALGVALSRLQGDGTDNSTGLLQALIPLAVVGALIYGLLTIAQQISVRVTLALAGLTLAVLLGGYMLRSSWHAVYERPDVPVELLVYTQTSPDVPRYVDIVRDIAINQTRTQRTDADVTGGLSMPLVLSGGEHSLAWPLQWYLRDFQNLVWRGDSEMQTATLQDFEVTLPNGELGLAPVLMLATPHVNGALREELQTAYVQPYGQGVFNWWFPEGNKCDPAAPGYKRFYYDSVTSAGKLAEAPPDGCVEPTYTPEQAQQRVDQLMAQVAPPWQPFIHPFLPDNIAATRDYVLFRELPPTLPLGSRDMEVWIRSDLVAGGTATELPPTAQLQTMTLAATEQYGDESTLGRPTGITVDADGRVYVADTLNHRIQIFAPDGDLVQTIGGYGSDEGQFNEPRGIAVDGDGNIYVADTWNARIVKLDADGEWLTAWGTGQPLAPGDDRLATVTGATLEGNAANPLGFFGPRGVAVDSNGNVYVADTGNRRIVVTDDAGEFVTQWGAEGSSEGQFREPIAVAVDEQGRVFVADSWNGRVQVFDVVSDAAVPQPLATWRVSGWAADTYDDPSLTVSPDGSRVFVTVPTRQRVIATTATGEPVLAWGGNGTGLDGIGSPSGLAAPSSTDVYVVDRDRARVLRYSVPAMAPAPLTE